ncbi:fluoride efflux transporter FluC [Actinomadura rayongensis]|uniref:Fluoride-specific ion channel FluC n=1 Tax=Actinomadura rayongensis TaxID=1429076 RepID=A0A6I4WD74_9ACTN|nr:CrcB family protein [Actinomadura rayongensis]MXQ67073.1 fluoride efflux transporter CrcB [Actinomadura rayongensis]
MPQEPVDPDVEPPILPRVPRPVLTAIAAGGALGALARYGVGAALPHAATEFAWSTFLINVSGCLLIGVLMAVLAARPGLPALTRPFLGVGVLGGYTTFSGYVVDAQQAVRAGAPGVAVAYLAATLAAALAAVTLGAAVTRRVLGGRR